MTLTAQEGLGSKIWQYKLKKGRRFYLATRVGKNHTVAKSEYRIAISDLEMHRKSPYQNRTHKFKKLSKSSKNPTYNFNLLLSQTFLDVIICIELEAMC